MDEATSGNNPVNPDISAPTTARFTPVHVRTQERLELSGVSGLPATARVILSIDRTAAPIVITAVPAPAEHAAPEGQRAARIAALLDHPNAISLHDVNQMDNATYVVMRRIAGISLGELIRHSLEGAQDKVRDPRIAKPHQVAALIMAAAAALERAHGLGILHRGISPEGIIVGADGAVVLADWEHAQLPGEASSAGEGPAGPVIPAYMAPEIARGGKADAGSDIFALGATLFHAIFLRLPGNLTDAQATITSRAQGEWPQPSAQQQRRVPMPLLAIINHAIAADPAERYHAIADLRADLRIYLEELSPTTAAAKKSRGSTLKYVIAALVLGGLALGGRWLWQYASTNERWGQTVIDEKFADNGWDKRWVTGNGANWRRDGGNLVSTGPTTSLLLCPRRLHTPLSVEYDAEILPGSQPCDISLIWWEGPNVKDPNRFYFDRTYAGYMVQLGAHDNQFCAIFRRPEWKQVAFNPRRLDIGHRYHVQIEFEKDAVRAIVDGQVWLEYRDIFPARDGYFALYAFYPGKAFANVKVRSKGLPDALPVLATGDAAFQYGQWQMAIDEWQRVEESMPGTTIGADAALRIGLADLRAGNATAADIAWTGLDGDRAAAAAVMRMKDRWDRGERDGFAADFTSLWHLLPQSHDQLTTTWSLCLGQVPSTPPVRNDHDVHLLLDLRDRFFPDDAASEWDASALKIYAGRAEEVAAKSPFASCIDDALLALGRNRAVLARKDPLPNVNLAAHLGAADIDAILNDRWKSLSQPGWLLAKAGRDAEALALNDDRELLNLMLGDPALVPDETWAENINASCILTGRLEEAAGPPRPWHSGGSWAAQALLRREDQPATFDGTIYQLRQLQWLRALEDGVEPDPGLAAAVAGDPIDQRNWTGWFVPWFALPFVQGKFAGAAGRAGLDKLSKDSTDTFAQRPHFLAGLIGGSIDRDAFIAQPIRAEAEAWFLVGTAMRADLDGDHTAALKNYAAFRALPLQRRLLDRSCLDPCVERFVAWRLKQP